MTVKGQLEWPDYLEAQRLSAGSSRRARVIWGIVDVLLILIVGPGVYALVEYSKGNPFSYVWPVTYLLVVSALYWGYVYFIYPRQLRKLFNQNKEISIPFEEDFTAEGLASTTAFGHSLRPWTNFWKWQENKNLVLLYFSDNQFIIVPKRLCTAGDLDNLRGYLRAAEVREVRGH